jgi:predicted nucleic acid-binding protein
VKSGVTVTEHLRGLYLDANVFIQALEGVGEIRDPIVSFFKLAKDGKARVDTSELTLSEVLAKPEMNGDQTLKHAYLDLIVWSGVVTLAPVTRSILVESARYRAISRRLNSTPGRDRRNFLPDAIHVVTAIESACGHFVTGDQRINLPVDILRVAPDGDGMRQITEAIS